MESAAAVTPRPLSAVILGSGNVASALAPTLEAAGAIDIKAVYSPDPAHAAALASRLRHASPVSDVSLIPADADFYLFAVKDAAIAPLADALPPLPHAIVAHTSGSVEAAVLSRLSPAFGVFYPLQTFSIGVPVDLATVPFFIEAADSPTRQSLRALALSLSTHVFDATSETRSRLHVAAVFACNFANHMWAIADDILRRETGTDISVLAPLLAETLRKATIIPPAKAQTGPAMRADIPVMQRHMHMLPDDEATLYSIISRAIMNYHDITPPQPLAP